MGSIGSNISEWEDYELVERERRKMEELVDARTMLRATRAGLVDDGGMMASLRYHEASGSTPVRRHGPLRARPSLPAAAATAPCSV